MTYKIERLEILTDMICKERNDRAYGLLVKTLNKMHKKGLDVPLYYTEQAIIYMRQYGNKIMSVALLSLTLSGCTPPLNCKFIMTENKLVDYGNAVMQSVKEFEVKYNCKLLFKEVPDPERFGVATINNGKLVEIIEKPSNPKSNLGSIGVYIYDSHVFKVIDTLKLSERGEYEITDINNFYIKNGKCDFNVIDGGWQDVGAFDAYMIANNLLYSGYLT